jgi:crossover junction endodeoxyribonuclease RuvC
MIKVLGVDPGLAATGVGLVWGNGMRPAGFAYGAITTSRHWDMGRRLETLYDRLAKLLGDEAPGQMVVEDVFSLEKYPRSGITLGKVCGVILLAGQRAGVPVVEVPVREAKQVLTGNGAASKMQLERAVRHALGCPQPIRPYHAADALGLALIGMYRTGPPRLVAR